MGIEVNILIEESMTVCYRARQRNLIVDHKAPCG